MIKVKNINLFINLLCIVILFIFSSCGKDGNDSTGVSGKIISFNSSGVPVDNSVYFEKLESDNDDIYMALKVKGGADVFGCAIEINYDSTMLKYLSYSRGDYLGTAQDSILYAMLDKGQEGILLVGSDKKGAVPGANGDGYLVIIVFKVIDLPTSTDIGFNVTNSCLKSTSASDPDISGTIWLGGTLSRQ